MNRRAFLSLRHSHSSRWNSFRVGLERCGYSVTIGDFEPTPEDVLVSWNRFPNIETTAQRFERAGALVLIVENAWIKPVSKRENMLAICANHHNGAGWWPIGNASRWDSFGIDILPWRTKGERILVLPQRGYGETQVAMPHSWVQNVGERVAQFTRRPMTVRPHPGLYRPKEIDFSKTFAVVTWASGGAIKALAAGIPVFYEMKKWIGASAAKYGLRDIENPFLGDRLPMFRRLAWAQWRLGEVESGEIFDRFIGAKYDERDNWNNSSLSLEQVKRSGE